MNANQISDLQLNGYYVEDMEEVWGSEYKGNFRWVNGEDFGEIEYSRTDAWKEAWIDFNWKEALVF